MILDDILWFSCKYLLNKHIIFSLSAINKSARFEKVYIFMEPLVLFGSTSFLGLHFNEIRIVFSLICYSIDVYEYFYKNKYISQISESYCTYSVDFCDTIANNFRWITNAYRFPSLYSFSQLNNLQYSHLNVIAFFYVF